MIGARSYADHCALEQEGSLDAWWDQPGVHWLVRADMPAGSCEMVGGTLCRLAHSH